MKLVLIRHARAEARRLLQRDRTRALTADGQRRMRRAVRGLRTVLPEITVIAHSPLARARQTAELVAAGYADAGRQQLAPLAPGGSARDLLTCLRRQPADACVALVGHEPDLGRLAGWLLTGRAAGFVHFRKGAAMLIEFDGAPRAGGGTLSWLLTAPQLAGLR